MQKRKIAVLVVFAISLFLEFSQAQSASVLTYIARYKDLAIAEMERTGIPAAITLAQGIHETDAGSSDLVKKSNNHFGIKCKDNWRGKSVSHDDDARGECFRKYEAPEESYRDHSDFLRTRSNYASLFNLDPMNYEAWAYGLKKAGYATNPKYAQILIKLIQDYHLQDYTLIAMGKMEHQDDLATNNKFPGDKKKKKNVVAVNDKNNTPITDEKNPGEDKPIMAAVKVDRIDYPSGEFKLNETRVLYVRRGTSYLTIAQQHEIPLARLFEFNDLKQQEVTAYDQLVFIQRKRKTGEHEFHTVMPGENLNSIAQMEAIRLESLLEYNNLGANMQPATGETLYLRSKSPSMPKLTAKNAPVEILNEASQSIAVNDMRMEKKQTSQKNNFIVHKVQSEETVYSIARKYDVSAVDVINWNRMRSYQVKVGESLKIYR